MQNLFSLNVIYPTKEEYDIALAIKNNNKYSYQSYSVYIGPQEKIDILIDKINNQNIDIDLSKNIFYEDSSTIGICPIVDDIIKIVILMRKGIL